jgi:NADPH:quinone reductase-like Zn-dependent oxidoreductase
MSIKTNKLEALGYNQFGGIEVLEVIEVQEPAINDSEILVRVKSVSLNSIEWKFRNGKMKLMSGKKFPQFMGVEFSGVVEKVGNNVSAYKAGDEVFGFSNKKKGGSLQEKVAVTADLITRKPQNISFEQAASIPTVGSAAMIGLYKAIRLKSHQKILINGCVGNIGIWATQIASKENLDITGACSTAGVDFAKKLGCKTVIDYKKENVFERNVRYDIVFDTANVLDFSSVKNILKKGGTFLNPTPTLSQIIGSKILNLISSKKHKVILGAPNLRFLEKLAVFSEFQNFQIPVKKIFSFPEYKQAYNYAEKGGFIGKMVINMD